MDTTLRAKFNPYWVALWAVNTLALAVLAPRLTPGAWVAAFSVLFLLPEMIGLVHRGDSLPPLTYAVRRYLPRWMPDMVTFAAGAWVAWLWIPIAVHPLVCAVSVAGFVGWLTNHWSRTYEGPGE